MNPLIKKEIRLLLPAWIVAMSIATMPLWIIGPFVSADDIASNFSPLALAMLGMLLMSITTFGNEMTFNMFPHLLSQPVSRSRVWRIKISLLCIAFTLTLAAATFSWALLLYCHSDFLPSLFGNGFSDAELWIFVIALAFSSGGLWTTLLLRQTIGAFSFTLLIPLVISFGTSSLLAALNVSDSAIHFTVVFVLLIYSIAGFFWARWLFLRAQDTQWTGGQFSFSWRRKTTDSQTASISIRPRHWLLALAWKEIQLHQANYLIAALILALDVASVIIHKIHPRFQDPDLQFAIEGVGTFWILLPWLIGSTAVAEERRSGIMESQLCLPVSRRAQLAVKFCVALILSLFLGGLVPLLIEATKELYPAVLIYAAVIFFISFYASSLARATLHAIGLAIVIAAMIFAYAIGTIVYWVHYFSGYAFPGHATLGLGLLNLYLGVPILVLVLAGLIFWNFKWLHQNAELWLRNAIAVFAAFAIIFTLTNAIYFRAWELLMPIQPPSGPARLDNSSEVKFVMGPSTLYATLPDGRLWSETLAYNEVSNRWVREVWITPKYTEWIGGSNWADVASDRYQALGIRSDGTLWSIQRPWNPSRWPESQTGPFTVTQIGSDTDWEQVAGDSSFMLLKNDGSLWKWGTHEYDWRHPRNSIQKKFKLDLATPPAGVGNGTNWTRLFSSQGGPFAEKNDGSVWGWEGLGYRDTNYSYSYTLTQETDLPRRAYSTVVDWTGGTYAAIQTNGELWFMEQYNVERRGRETLETTRFQLGENWRWKAVTFSDLHIIAIRSDGTLWQFPPTWTWHLAPPKPVQLGNHSDWFALIGGWNTGFALAADGSVWDWAEPSKHVRLAPSRRPVYMGNIFQETLGR